MTGNRQGEISQRTAAPSARLCNSAARRASVRSCRASGKESVTSPRRTGGVHSRGSHVIFPQPNYADTLISQESGEKKDFLSVPQSLLEDKKETFSQTYSHEVSLTADSRGSHVIFPQPNYADTLISQESCEKKDFLSEPQFLPEDKQETFSQTYSHEVSLTADSRGSHVIFPQPNYADTLVSQESCGKSEPLLISQDLLETKGDPNELQQAPPNTDWRFSQAQRPGTSGSQNGDETGTWPNNQFDTEMLQAMILASASEAADGSSTLGGGAGTMGLSARYGPQFTLQHVPDYRQNVYIPGSNATLTNAAGKRDGKAPAGGNGNKKKSGKKEKK
ncbi:hypothetical protein AB1E18_005491 [Capra hircus]